MARMHGACACETPKYILKIYKWCGMKCSTRKSIARLCSEDIAIRTRSIYVAVTMDFSIGLCDAVQCKKWIQLVAIITPSFICVYLFSFDVWTA